jgi:hypothetical protein
MMKIKVRNTFSCCYASRIDYRAQIALTINFQLFSQPSQAIADILPIFAIADICLP